ncbi:CMRF35-like molecule 9 isoform X1 [Enhydra lutris kenyoni]|uniref:CMRF35-like molecule 9 isoform X1 n=1 Tax=Enhydra lutris kenyoni TaxID=391180 RepID=A0A2Y9KNX2_ENHLU|nr:CMRF35-like molecule 9 isoform X1 [Enhydra lutris kenyoni]
MWALVLVWGCLLLPGYGAMVGPKEISGFEGDTVSLQCTYQEELRTHQKYWCRQGGFLMSRCLNTIYAGEDGQETTEGRVSIQDSPQTLTLHVTLRKLTLQDSGKYYCGVSKLGRDESVLVSLLVFPGPCCPPSPTPSFQPLTTRSFQPKAKAWQTQPPELTSPGLHQTVTTAKQGKTGAEASPLMGTSPAQHPGSSPDTGTSPYAGTSLHEATSPHAGTSRPPTQPDFTSAEDTPLSPSSSSSVSSVSIPTVRILAPVFVLLALLLASGLAALSNYVLRWKKEARLATETQRNGKVHPSHLPLEYTVINLAGPPGPHASPSPCTETQGLSQTSEEDEAPSQDPEGDMIPGPPLHMSGEELGFSKFISV